MSDFGFSWKLLLTLQYFIDTTKDVKELSKLSNILDTTIPYRFFSISSNKVTCGGWLRDLNPYVLKVSGC